MTTSPTVPTPSQTLSERVPLRLSVDKSVHDGPLDGAWWPQSRDLKREAADLVDHFPDEVGRIERLLFSRPDWDAVEVRRIPIARGVVKVGSFPSDDTHVMVLKMSAGQRLRLLVVPSDTESGQAERIMKQAADVGNTASPSTLLGLTGPDQSEIGDAAWTDHADGPK